MKPVSRVVHSVWAYALLGWFIALVAAELLALALSLSSFGAFFVGAACGAVGAYSGIVVGALRGAR